MMKARTTQVVRALFQEIRSLNAMAGQYSDNALLSRIASKVTGRAVSGSDNALLGVIATELTGVKREGFDNTLLVEISRAITGERSEGSDNTLLARCAGALRGSEVSGPDNTLLEIISELIESATSDPIAGVSLAFRLQTHTGDNVPLGIYQDVDCTIPATQEGDLIAAWRDEITESGVIFLQATESKRPQLHFVAGVPRVKCDGVDDFLVAAVALETVDADVYFRGRFASPSSRTYSPVLLGAYTTSYCYFQITPDAIGGTRNRTPCTHMATLHLRQSGGASTLSSDAAVVETRAAVLDFSATHLVIGAQTSAGGAPLDCTPAEVEAIIWGNALAAEDAAAIDSYLSPAAGLPRVVCAGDSITHGTYNSSPILPGQEWPALLQAARPDVQVINFGEVGVQGFAGHTARLNSYLLNGAAKMVMLIGTNMTPGFAGSTIFDSQYYPLLALAAGYDVRACTLIARSDASETTQTSLASYNSTLRTRYLDLPGCTALIDLAANAAFDDPADAASLTNYTDGLHPNASGQALIASLIEAGIV